MENLDLKETVQPDNNLKRMVIEYIGTKVKPEDNKVTVEMVLDVLAEEFPEFVLAIAEENWIRGYQQGLDDIEAGRKIFEKNEKRKSCKLCEE